MKSPRAVHLLCFLCALLLPHYGRAARATENWENLCARCHGANGDGRTPQGRKNHIKDYSSPKVQATFTDAGLLKNLMLGLGGEGDEQRMPAYKDKLTLAEAKDLITLIRSFGKPAAEK